MFGSDDHDQKWYKISLRFDAALISLPGIYSRPEAPQYMIDQWKAKYGVTGDPLFVSEVTDPETHELPERMNLAPANVSQR